MDVCCSPTPVTDLIWLPGEMNNYSQLTTHPMQWGIGWHPQSDWTVISYMLSAFKPFTVTSVTGCSWKLISQAAPSQKYFIKSAWTQEELMCGSDYRKVKDFWLWAANSMYRHTWFFILAFFYSLDIQHPLKPFIEVQIFTPPTSNHQAEENADKTVSELKAQAGVLSTVPLMSNRLEL